jgi:haloalkane dehalogenase
MEVLRTPDDRFDDLPDFGYRPQYLDAGVRVHYIDAGPASAPPVLLMHGEPSWSFLYRRMIPPLVAAGHRVIAIDLVGFGRSDKPVSRSDHTYARHVGWMHDALRTLDLRDITLVCQDWGGLISLRLLAADSARFARVVAANTALPTGDERVPEAFRRWRDFSQRAPQFAVGNIVNGGCVTDLDAAVVAAYDAPFPDDRYKAGPRQMPLLVPITPDDPESAANRVAWERLEKWDKPFLCAFSDSDPVTRGADRVFRERIPGCSGQPHTTIAGAGHFLQEDRGEELAMVVIEFIRAAGA